MNDDTDDSTIEQRLKLVTTQLELITELLKRMLQELEYQSSKMAARK